MTGFLDALASRPLLFDGAMGSLLYDRGVMHTHSYDELNLSRPELIREIHQQYRAAGADILESNTFGANRIMLGRHGFADRVGEINRAAVELARSAADGAFVAGAIGPTGVKFAVATDQERELARAALREQIEILVESGVDLLVLETFTSIVEIEAALEIARSVDPDLPRVAQMVFDAQSLVEGVLTPEEIAARLVTAGADVVGGNCGLGPPELYDVGHRLVGHGAPVSIQPNAGLPSSVDGRTIYVANPEHFGVFARRMLKSGVRLIGGCCGTTPEHIRSMSGAVRMMGGGPARAGLGGAQSSPTAIPQRPAIVPLAERSRLGARVAAGEFVVSVEVNAPSGTDATKALGHVRQAAEGGIDIVNVADGPRATSRMSNLAFCAQAIAGTTVEPILHVCCRDRNYLGLVAHLLGAHALGIRNLVIITGDPPKMGDYAFATPVYDVDSIGLLEIASAMNAGFDPTGNELAGATSFVLATGAEPAAADRDRELERLQRKKDAGAELVMTQPVYDPETLASFIEDAAPIGLPIMVGLLPLASYRNAEFLHNEVPGMQIPLAYRERMAAVGSGPLARAEGIAIAREALEGVQDRVAGAYIMPPFNRIDAAFSILDVVRGNRWTPAG
ncbi:MAG: Methylenetetrahydrofolate reductase family protein [Acidimicrobiales bacterium]|nr:Methylenetetrahydrofolate reductase family protein [Acidimicrobiales bacterium]